jgi:hypothetical protein
MADPAVDSGTLENMIAQLSVGDAAASAALIHHNARRLESLARHM